MCKYLYINRDECAEYTEIIIKRLISLKIAKCDFCIIYHLWHIIYAMYNVSTKWKKVAYHI